MFLFRETRRDRIDGAGRRGKALCCADSAPVVPRRRQALLQPEHLDEVRGEAEDLARLCPAEALHKESREALRTQVDSGN